MKLGGKLLCKKSEEAKIVIHCSVTGYTKGAEDQYYYVKLLLFLQYL